ncbi:MAG: GntR family transcriptional regulator [Candidatus Omnitrophica bacterium]|nr:GntR family transcriptional regulator [Candidatus Omnitrophota bacterium]
MQKKPKYYFQINPSSGVPVYRQVMDQVKTQIALDHLPRGSFLPSVRQMSKDLEINPMTVSKAYSLLEKDGIVEHVRGQGMKITQGPLAQKFLNVSHESIGPLLSEVITKSKQLSLTVSHLHKLIDDAWDKEN